MSATFSYIEQIPMKTSRKKKIQIFEDRSVTLQSLSIIILSETLSQWKFSHLNFSLHRVFSSRKQRRTLLFSSPRDRLLIHHFMNFLFYIVSFLSAFLRQNQHFRGVEGGDIQEIINISRCKLYYYKDYSDRIVFTLASNMFNKSVIFFERSKKVEFF